MKPSLEIRFIKSRLEKKVHPECCQGKKLIKDKLGYAYCMPLGTLIKDVNNKK